MIIKKSNPFAINRPIEHSKLFVGRDKEVNEIFQSIYGSEEPQTIAIYGPRRSGKSSILQYIATKDAKLRFLDVAAQRQMYQAEDLVNRSIFVILDLKPLHDQYRHEDFVTEFWKNLLDRMLESLKQVEDVYDNIQDLVTELRSSAKSKEHDVNNIYDVLDKLTNGEFFFVIGLDHSEIIFQLAEHGGYEISENLAGIRRVYREDIVYVSVLPNNLVQMEQTFNQWRGPNSPESPFYNGIIQIELGLLRSRDEARALIMRTLEAHEIGFVFSDEEMKYIVDWGGYHPYTLNVTAHTYFNYKSIMFKPEPNYTSLEIRKRASIMLSRFFWQMWNDLDSKQENGTLSEARYSPLQKLVIRIAGKMNYISDIDNFSLQHLQSAGIIIIDAEENMHLFAGLFRDFVIEETLGSYPLDLAEEKNSAGCPHRDECYININGKQISLKQRYYRILQLLSSKPGTSIPIGEIAEAGQIDEEPVDEKQVPVLVARLRNAIKDNVPNHPTEIEIVKFGNGYVLRYHLHVNFS